MTQIGGGAFFILCMLWRPIRGGELGEASGLENPIVAGTPKMLGLARCRGGGLPEATQQKWVLKEDLWTPNPGYLGRERETS